MKEIDKEITFNDKGTFMAYRSAEQWAMDSGYSVGSMCSPMPTALYKGDYLVAKWKNLSVKERKQADGTITGEYREGPVKVTIFKDLTDGRS